MKLYRTIPYLLGSVWLLLLSLESIAIVQAKPMADVKESDPSLADNGNPLTPDGGGTHQRDIPAGVTYNAPDLADLGAPPGRRGGGASRAGNNCPVPEAPFLTALVPAVQITSSRQSSEDGSASTYESVLTLTTQARPTFWFYVPYYLDTTSITFVLQDEGNNTLYQTRLTSRKHERGVVHISLPENAPALQPNSRYQWYLALDCDPNEYARGWIDRVPLAAPLATALDAATPYDRVALYADHSLWQEAITQLGDLYRAAPNDPTLADNWYRLLESGDLEPFTQYPLIDCCTP